MGLDSLPQGLDWQRITVGDQVLSVELEQQPLRVQERCLSAGHVANAEVSARQGKLSERAVRVAERRSPEPFEG
jgi:hypothetical protein